MKLVPKDARLRVLAKDPPCGITAAAASQFILRSQDCSGPTEASERTAINTALALAKLIEILHGKKRINNADVLDILSDYEEAVEAE